MAIHRSPNYPAHGLSEVLDMVRRIYEKEKRSQSSGEIVAKALGYSSLSGNARVKIGSLKQYGLLEGDERKGMRITDLAMQILYPSSGLEQSDALKKAALTPALFNSLYGEKREASDESLVNYLVSRMDFSPNGASQAIGAFRDTMNASGLVNFGYNEQETPSAAEAQSMQTETRSASITPQATIPAASGDMNAWTWTLSIPRSVKAELRIVGQPTKADVGRLKKQIEALEEAFEEETQ